MRIAKGFFIVLAVLAGLGGGDARGQDETGGAKPSLSRQMQMAIQFYEKGDDMRAMDRFMEILTKGDPSERSLANEFLNMITRRMNTGENVALPARPGVTAVEAVSPKAPEAAVHAAPAAAAAAPLQGSAAAPAGMGRPAAPPASAEANPVFQAPPPRVDKVLMMREITAKIRALREASLRQLRAVAGVQVLSGANGELQAVALPSSALFASGTLFRKDAVKTLDALTKLIYTLAGAQVVILPEGTSIGDAKILDMRRTMGISAALYAAGIAPVRLRVNLLNSQVDIPKALQSFKGVIVLFSYAQPLNLVAETALGDEAGPPLSLGAYPGAFHAGRSEGAIIEFSVLEPPAGLASWKFQLLAPSDSEERGLEPLEDFMGASPVYHQKYWNGRRNYFGRVVPSGRYECVLTATDGRNRQKTLHRWIQVVGAAAAMPL